MTTFIMTTRNWQQANIDDDRSKETPLPPNKILRAGMTTQGPKNTIGDGEETQGGSNAGRVLHKYSDHDNEMIAKLSKPQTETQQMHEICAVKWQSMKVGGKSSKLVLFDVVYDARKEGSLKNYGEQPICQVGNLKRSDLVLLEAKIMRYSVKNEKGRWISRAQYEMVAILLLNMSEINKEKENE
ncbi:hypothetical protein C8R48DRAFT_676667 [Suillus tomentosus]|nr:hypothetical protein C8R48DRAFT_676667 [Suillus tomentosus]